MSRTLRHLRLLWLVGILTVMLATPRVASAQVGSLSDDDLCDLTPTDGSWMVDLWSANYELSVLGLTSFDVEVEGAQAGCANRWPYTDGTMISVGVFVLASEADAAAATELLRSRAEGVVPVQGFASSGLGGEAWIADFTYQQLAFTHVGRFVVGGLSDEAYTYNRDTYDELLVERMGRIVDNIVDSGLAGSSEGAAAAHEEPGGAVCACDEIPDSLPAALVGTGVVAGIAAGGAAVGVPGRRRT